MAGNKSLSTTGKIEPRSIGKYLYVALALPSFLAHHLTSSLLALFPSNHLHNATMAEVLVQEGKAPFKVSSIDELCFTYYKIIGDLSSGTPPVVVAHGGPGAGHEYLLTFADLWRDYGLPVVFYDQIGCASSTHLPQKAGDQEFWQEQLFQDELDNLLDHLELRRGPGFHLLGQSWGGMLGSAFAARQPRGLRRLVLASALASKELASRGMRLLRDQMPPEMQRALEEAERKGEYDSPAYKNALDYYYRKHVCRADPFPPAELLPGLKNLSEDTTVYGTMYVILLSFVCPFLDTPTHTRTHIRTQANTNETKEKEKGGWGDEDERKDRDILDFRHFTLTLCAPFPSYSLTVLYFLSNYSSGFTADILRYGPSPLTAVGSLKNWTVVHRLPNITATTLVYNGEYDTSHDVAQVPFFELIPRVRWITFPDAGHMCHLEGGGLRERILKVVGEFLTQKEIAEV